MNNGFDVTVLGSIVKQITLKRKVGIDENVASLKNRFGIFGYRIDFKRVFLRVVFMQPRVYFCKC